MAIASRRRNRRPIDKPPRQFPTVIRVHAYDPSGLGTCLVCGQEPKNRLHITPHFFEVNLNSTLHRCMCGYNESHSIHLRSN